MSEHKIPIPSMIYNAAVGGHITNSQQIIDENLNREQQDINEEVVAVPYNATTPNGMGKIVLKKNDNFKQVVEKQTNGNTIFVIKYDFTLTDNVNIPANSILYFEGGSISGDYTIIGDLTCINGFVKFANNVSFEGTYNNIPTVYVDWFVTNYSANTDCSEAIRKAISLAKLARTSLTFGGSVSDVAEKYYCTSGNFDISGLVINGNGSWIVGVGDYNMFIVDGNCCVRDLHINKFPYQDSTQVANLSNFAIKCTKNHNMKFDNVLIDGFYYGFILDAAWNVIIDGCSTYRCNVGVEGRFNNNYNGNTVSKQTVNNNICNSRISGDKYGINCVGISEGWIITNNIIVSGNGTGIKLDNFANIIIKGNIIDLCKKHGIEIVRNSPGVIIEGNYIATRAGGGTIVDIYAQSYVSMNPAEDQIISVINNTIRCYGVPISSAIKVSEGTYKHIRICNNHIKGVNLSYGVEIASNSTVTVLFVKDNVVEGTARDLPTHIANVVTNKIEENNIKLTLTD